MNEEYLVSAIHQIALITSLPFVHTARRSYRLNDQMKCSDWVFADKCPSRGTVSEGPRRTVNLII